MTSGTRYTDEFKREAVRQVTERGHKLAEVAERLGISVWSLSRWKRRFGDSAGGEPSSMPAALPADASAEIVRLKAELRRVTEERDILKKATAYFARQSG